VVDQVLVGSPSRELGTRQFGCDRSRAATHRPSPVGPFPLAFPCGRDPVSE
jgi:hypothetical protein